VQPRGRDERPHHGRLIDKASPARAPRAAQNCARLLLLRDGDCREECVLGKRRVCQIALEQDLAAQAMQESVAPAFTCLTC